jgi:hypothetical protein
MLVAPAILTPLVPGGVEKSEVLILVTTPGGSVSAFCHRHFEFMGDTQISRGYGKGLVGQKKAG